MISLESVFWDGFACEEMRNTKCIWKLYNFNDISIAIYAVVLCFWHENFQFNNCHDLTLTLLSHWNCSNYIKWNIKTNDIISNQMNWDQEKSLI